MMSKFDDSTEKYTEDDATTANKIHRIPKFKPKLNNITYNKANTQNIKPFKYGEPIFGPPELLNDMMKRAVENHNKITAAKREAARLKVPNDELTKSPILSTKDEDNANQDFLVKEVAEKEKNDMSITPKEHVEMPGAIQENTQPKEIKTYKCDGMLELLKVLTKANISTTNVVTLPENVVIEKFGKSVTSKTYGDNDADPDSNEASTSTEIS